MLNGTFPKTTGFISLVVLGESSLENIWEGKDQSKNMVTRGNCIAFTADQSDFLLPVDPGSNNWRLPMRKFTLNIFVH